MYKQRESHREEPTGHRCHLQDSIAKPRWIVLEKNRTADRATTGRSNQELGSRLTGEEALKFDRSCFARSVCRGGCSARTHLINYVRQD
jgi:radical SAM protein with 4Fe4S-binding SPASM domain